MANINFNELAWKAPQHGDRFGYIPTDDHYDDIVAWLKTGTKRWTEKTRYSDGTPVVKTRLSFGTQYDVVVDYIPETKMIAYVFRDHNKYSI